MGRKCNDTSGPFNFRGCDLTAEWFLAREHVRVRFPATAPAFARSGARTKAVASKRIARRRTYTKSAPGYGSAGQFPTSRAPACAAESPKLSLPGAAPGRLAILGSWQTSNALALQASQCGSVTHRLHQFQFTAGNSTNAQREAS